MHELKNKVAVVTGGSGGIGQAIGRAMLAEGMRVVLADITEDALRRVEKEVASPDLIGIPVDVTDFDSLCSLREKTIQHFGSVHVIVNNAAVGAGAKGSVWEHHLNDWRWSLDVNVMGVINGMNAFVPTLIEQDEGHVVNTSSGNGAYYPIASSGIYPVTKAAVTTLTECLWGQLREIGSAVSATVLLPSSRTPGVLATGIWMAGANRPSRYMRGDPDDGRPRDALAEYKARAAAAGQEVPEAPLSEVADLCIRGIRDDLFWATYPLESMMKKLDQRYASMRNLTPPEYLREVNLMAAAADERSKQWALGLPAEGIQSQRRVRSRFLLPPTSLRLQRLCGRYPRASPKRPRFSRVLGDILPAVRVPTLVIAAERDAFPVECVRYIAEQIEGARFALIEGRSHCAPVTAPDLFAEIVHTFASPPDRFRRRSGRASCV